MSWFGKDAVVDPMQMGKDAISGLSMSVMLIPFGISTNIQNVSQKANPEVKKIMDDIDTAIKGNEPIGLQKLQEYSNTLAKYALTEGEGNTKNATWAHDGGSTEVQITDVIDRGGKRYFVNETNQLMPEEEVQYSSLPEAVYQSMTPQSKNKSNDTSGYKPYSMELINQMAQKAKDIGLYDEIAQGLNNGEYQTSVEAAIEDKLPSDMVNEERGKLQHYAGDREVTEEYARGLLASKLVGYVSDYINYGDGKVQRTEKIISNPNYTPKDIDTGGQPVQTTRSSSSMKASIKQGQTMPPINSGKFKEALDSLRKLKMPEDEVINKLYEVYQNKGFLSITKDDIRLLVNTSDNTNSKFSQTDRDIIEKSVKYAKLKGVGAVSADFVRRKFKVSSQLAETLADEANKRLSQKEGVKGAKKEAAETTDRGKGSSSKSAGQEEREKSRPDDKVQNVPKRTEGEKTTGRRTINTKEDIEITFKRAAAHTEQITGKKSDAKIEKPTEKWQSNVIRWMKNFGVDVIYYSSKSDLEREMVDHDNPRIVFIRTDFKDDFFFKSGKLTAEGAAWYAGHGFLHTLKLNHVDFIMTLKKQWMLQRLKNRLKNIRKAYWI
jgi:hypothetical protein